MSSEKNESQVSQEIIIALNQMLSKGSCGQRIRSLDECNYVARKIGFYIDEHSVECLEAKADAIEMLKNLECRKAEEKANLLPLQMIAIKIGERNREKCQLKQKGNTVTEEYILKVQSELNQLRIKQTRYCKTFSKLINKFIKSFFYSPLKRRYFHCWVKLLADQSSINQLQPVREKYNAKWNQLCDAVYKQGNKQTPEIQLLKRTLDELHQQLTDLSVGLEHFNREIGQIYEMIIHFNFSTSTYSVQRFPVVAADMLLEGHPLELMDGDASDVPIAWIKDVMFCLKEKIGNKRLFVLSVLGIQSTGKSTMLNVMFGLQFAVSAGRCTKGVFAQLVQLKPDLQQSSECDYILVVDTEGLRAPELASIDHTNRDNEIATLVIGLGDATIINIMGENPTDMQDTLQIVVHALMKMENVKMKPSCLFVHQNVTDISASDRNTVQRMKMKKMLDEITRIAAKEENCSDRYKEFSDVITFQENKHVVYISSLWQGDPPMAPPNPGYSSCILQVREKVIELMHNCHCQTISDFHNKLADLWKAILSENFVFSFRNTLEIQAFNALETQYVEHSRTLRRNAMVCVNGLRTECSKLTPQLLKIDGEKKLSKHLTKLDKEIKVFEESMGNYFIYQPKARQWKGRTELRMDDLCKDLRNSLKAELMAIKKKIIGRAKIDSDIVKYKKCIQQKAKQLADEFKETDKIFTNDKLESEFNTHWDDWVADIPELEDPVDIKSTLEKIFGDLFSRNKQPTVNQIISKRKYMDDVNSDDITSNVWINHLTYYFSADACTDLAKDITNTIKLDSVKTIEVYKSEGKTFTEEIGKYMFDFVHKRLDDVKKTNKFKFTEKGLIRITIKILLFLEGTFKDLQAAYRKENDLRKYMEFQKNRLWQMFRDECTIAKVCVSASYAVCRDLTSAINNALTEHCITGVIDHVRKSQSLIFANKMSYHAQLLVDLAEKMDFQAFRTYLTNPFSCMETAIGDTLREFCTTKDNEKETVIRSIYSQKVTELFNATRTAIFNTCKSSSLKSRSNMRIWWPKLLDHIGNKFDVKAEIGFLNNEAKFDVSELHDNLLNELEKSQKEMEDSFTINFLNELIEPCKKFFKTDLLGCPELCPFCNAPCDLQAGKKYDDHRTEYHRPKGVAGYRGLIDHKLVFDICTSSVMTDNTTFMNEDTNGKHHPYRDYQNLNDYYKAWKIQPMPGESQLYWKWFMATYNKELAVYHNSKPADIPDGWHKITWKTAKEDMINTYNL